MADIFDGDITQRYADQKDPGGASVPATWQEREQQIGREISAGPDSTVAGFAWNFEDRYVRNIESLVAAGNFAEAKRSYDQACSELDANREDLVTLSQIKDTGRLGDELAKRASGALLRSFNQNRVKLSDGTEASLGQVLADGSTFLTDKSNELKRMHFSDGSIADYLAGDNNIRAIMDPLVRGAAGGGADGVGNFLQLRDLADAYSANKERIAGVFGDGAGSFLDYVRETHRTSGNAAATMNSLLDFAEVYSDGTGVTGRQLASDIVGGYNDLLSTLYKGDVRKDSRGVSAQPEISDNQRREFDAILIPALKASVERSGSAFDLHDPRLRQSMLEVADTLAYTTALGGDIFSEARLAGSPLNQMFGSYVAEGLLGQRHQTDNIVGAVRDLRNQLSYRLVGGRDSATVATTLSGQSKDYLSNIEKTTGTRSLCPEADNLAADAHKFLARTLLPGMTSGRLSADTFEQMMQDDSASLVEGLASEFVRSFHGTGREELATELAKRVLSGFASGDRVCMEDIIGDLAYGKGRGNLSPSAIRTAGTWYHANVARALQFADRKASLRREYLASGRTDAQALAAVAAVSEAASDEESRGGNPAAVWDSAAGVGEYLVPEDVLDRNGKVVGQRITTAIGNRNRIPLKYRGNELPAGTFKNDRAAWDAFQVLLSEDHKRMLREEEYRNRLAIQQAAKDEM